MTFSLRLPINFLILIIFYIIINFTGHILDVTSWDYLDLHPNVLKAVAVATITKYTLMNN